MRVKKKERFTLSKFWFYVQQPRLVGACPRMRIHVGFRLVGKGTRNEIIEILLSVIYTNSFYSNSNLSINHLKI